MIFIEVQSMIQIKGGIAPIMKKQILLLSVIVLLGLCMSIYAADVTGTWESERASRGQGGQGGPGGMGGPGGQGGPGGMGQGQRSTKTTYVFKVSGSTLTGTVTSPFSGETPISEGKGSLGKSG